MKLNVTKCVVLMLGLVAVTSVSVYLKVSPIQDASQSGALKMVYSDSEVSVNAPVTTGGSSRSSKHDSPSGPAPAAFRIERNASGPQIVGERLPSVRSAIDPHSDRGRVARLSRSGVVAWHGFTAGDRITLPGFDGEEMAANIVLRTEDAGWLRLGGELESVEGTFAMNTNFDVVSGFILLPTLNLAYEITTEPSGDILMAERPIEALMCTKYKEFPSSATQPAGTSPSSVTIAQGAAVPSINTRPGAKGLIYVDFDGAQVTDPFWNGGRLISAAPSSFTTGQVDEIVRSVAEDYAPFDVTITTNLADYTAAPAGRRMWVIVTPTNTAAPGSGGVAYLNSWSGSSRVFSSTIPCWVFNPGVKAAAETISHEVGHTLGLSHDGTTTGSAYYSGHGGDLNVPTSWGPIMGAPFSKNVTQWSKDEYENANNTEDDMYLISRDLNGMGYRADALIGTAIGDVIRFLPVNSGTFDVGGLIRRSDAGDLHQFSTTGGSISASVRPLANTFANVDLQLELKDRSNATFAVSNPVESLGASLSCSLPAGTYWLVVRSASTGVRPEGGYTSGYSAYGSVGDYRLSGTISETVSTPLSPSVMVGDFRSSAIIVKTASTPLLPSLAKARGIVGQPFNYALDVAEGVQINGTPAPLPPGIRFDEATMAFSGMPTEAGEWNISLAVATSSERAEGILNVRIEPSDVSLSAGLGESRIMFTTPAAPWTGTIANRVEGIMAPVAVSGVVADNMASSVRILAKGPALMTFWWMASSEANRDTLQCRLNGKLVRDAFSGKPLLISGETGWLPAQVNIPQGNGHSIEFTYAKDAARRAGRDRGWVYGVQVTPIPPAFRRHPMVTTLFKGSGELRISANALEAVSYEWKLNGVTLFDETSPSRTVQGSRTPELVIKGLNVADSGAYTLEASNGFGTTVSRQALVQLPGLPVFTQQPVEPISMTAGDVLRLSVQVSGPGPISYTWYRNGQLLTRTPVPTLEVKTKSIQQSGLYKVIATNPYGSQTSREVRVTIAAK